jgi:hypothetical protein
MEYKITRFARRASMREFIAAEENRHDAGPDRSAWIIDGGGELTDV